MITLTAARRNLHRIAEGCQALAREAARNELLATTAADAEYWRGWATAMRAVAHACRNPEERFP